MKATSRLLSSASNLAQKCARPIVRWLGHAIAWNYPRLYLKLMIRFKLQRSVYYRLVQSRKADQNRVLLSDVHNALPKHSSRKNILYAIHWYELSGAELYALHTMKIAQGLGHRCYCISTVPSKNPERHAFEKYCVEALDFASSAQDKTSKNIFQTLSGRIL